MKPQTFAFTVCVLLLAAIGLIFTGRPPIPAPVPVPPEPTPPPRTFTVVGEGQVRVAPDVAIIRFSLESIAETVEAAQSQNDLAYAVLVNRLRSLGIDAGDIQVVGREVQPLGSTDLNGRRAVLAMLVRVRHMESLPEVRTAITLANPAHLQAIQYDLSDRSKAVHDALGKAMANAHDRANTVAAAVGAKLDGATATTVLEPGADPARPLEYDGGELIVRARVQVTYST